MPPIDRAARGGRTLAVLALCLGFASIGCAGEPPSPPAPLPPPPAGQVELTLYLLGDGGSPSPQGDPVLAALERELAADPHPTVVAFLGDNIYPRGLPAPEDPHRGEGERRLRVQLDAALTGAEQVIVLPGNHDWEAGGEGGWEAVRRQQELIDRSFDRRVRWLPRDGCPGPEVVDVGGRLRLVVLDSQWFLHRGPRPVGPDSGCAAADAEAAMRQLGEALAEAGELQVAVLAHHPLRSAGRHGGYFPWSDHVFPLRHLEPWLWVPLPGIGSAYPLARKLGISPQDQSAAGYRRWVDDLERVFAARPPLLVASGHEHNLEVLGGGTSPWLLISGAGQIGETTSVSSPPDARFAVRAAGFMRLAFLRQGGVRLEVLTVDERATVKTALRVDLVAPEGD